jgi:endonuclease/exonuclease/phosphatase family metal-dependent hydrolase
VWVDNVVPLTGTEAVVGQDQATIVDDYMEAQGFASPIPHDADTHEFPIDMRLDAVYARDAGVTAWGVADDVGGSDHVPVWIDIAP